MTNEGQTEAVETPRTWKDAAEDRIWARWRWLLILVVVVFVLNNLVGVIVGGLGLIAFVHRIAGQAVRAGRLAQQVREIVIEPPDDASDEAARKRRRPEA